MHIGNQVQTSSPLRASPERRTDLAPSEQQTDDQKEADKQELPSYGVRSGQANLQRFLAVHDKAGEASVDDNTSANAETDKPSTSAAEGSGVRRRASRTGKKASAGQTTEPSEGHGRDAAPSGSFSRPVNVLRKSLKLAFNIWAVAATASAGYRIVRNPGDFAKSPFLTTISGATFTNRVDERILQDAQHAVLDRFGSYIPADAPCHQVHAKISANVAVGGALGTYDPKENSLVLFPYLGNDIGLDVATHEYSHCYTHSQFSEALSESPNAYELDESLTEYMASKHPSNGRGWGGLMGLDFRLAQYYKKRKALKLEEAVGEETLKLAYFSGDKDAISKISRAAVDIYPKKVTIAAWNAATKVKNTGGMRRLVECFAGASLLAEGKLPGYYTGMYLPVQHFSSMDSWQKKAILEQAKQARDRLGAKFDQAFYNFDKTATDQAMKAVHEDLLANWEPVMSGKSYFDALWG